MDKILEGAEPPRSEEEVAVLLAEPGFEMPLRSFASLFRGRLAEPARFCAIKNGIYVRRG